MGYRHPGGSPPGPWALPKEGPGRTLLFSYLLGGYNPALSKFMVIYNPWTVHGPEALSRSLQTLTRPPIAESRREGNSAPHSLKPIFIPWQICANLQFNSPFWLIFCVNPPLKSVFCTLFSVIQTKVSAILCQVRTFGQSPSFNLFKEYKLWLSLSLLSFKVLLTSGCIIHPY